VKRAKQNRPFGEVRLTHMPSRLGWNRMLHNGSMQHTPSFVDPHIRLHAVGHSYGGLVARQIEGS
jgi:alpha-beta hydrolase superfamily lysophospholipase